MEQALVTKPQASGELTLYNQATNVAGLCKEIVLATAVEIQGRKFVPVEAWTTIAVAHGCIVTIKSVDEIASGMRAVAELRRQSDGVLLSSAEGFVGKDEPVWYGGLMMRWNKRKNAEEEVMMPKRAEYAIRAMAQTRGASRVCRTAFSHVVVMMKVGLETTPAEEMLSPQDAVDISVTAHNAAEDKKTATTPPTTTTATTEPEGKRAPEVPRDPGVAEIVALRPQFEGGKWKTVRIHFGKSGPQSIPGTDKKKPGMMLGELEERSLEWWINEWQPKPYGNSGISEENKILRAALDVAAAESK